MVAQGTHPSGSQKGWQELMEYRNLGNSGLKVSVLGLRADNFGWWIDEQHSTAIINHALELGINFNSMVLCYAINRVAFIINECRESKVIFH